MFPEQTRQFPTPWAIALASPSNQEATQSWLSTKTLFFFQGPSPGFQRELHHIAPSFPHNLLIHSTDILMGTHHVAGTVLGTGAMAVNKANESLCFHGADILVAKRGNKGKK